MSSEDGVRLGIAAARRLAALNWCRIDPGLTDAEFDRIEREYGVEFADDHRAFLSVGLPVWEPYHEDNCWTRPWLDWRHDHPDWLRRRVEYPVRMVLISIERGGWSDAFGERPIRREDAVTLATQVMSAAPRLVPLYAHRFLPGGAGTSGHPVLSVWEGFDTIVLGENLLDYIDREFLPDVDDDYDYENPPPEPRSDGLLPFWRSFVETEGRRA